LAAADIAGRAIMAGTQWQRHTKNNGKIYLDHIIPKDSSGNRQNEVQNHM
jgi:hypothetical protein